MKKEELKVGMKIKKKVSNDKLTVTAMGIYTFLYTSEDGTESRLAYDQLHKFDLVRTKLQYRAVSGWNDGLPSLYDFFDNHALETREVEE
jgi:hypothetical protein